MFSKNDYIKQYDGYFCCIVCDKDVAVFGRVTYNEKENCISTSYENVFIVSNNEEINKDIFIYEKATIEEIKNNR